MLTFPANASSGQADFSYDIAVDGAGLPARVAIYGESASQREQIAADLGGAGFRTIDGGSIAALIDGPIALLGDVVLVDCPPSGSHGLDGAMLAGLARLDMRVARAGARLIVTTTLDALDDVFAVFDQSAPQILVSPSRAERLVAVGRVMGEAGSARVREMAEEDRLALLRLAQQVEAIAQSLDRLSRPAAPAGVSGATALSDYRRPSDQSAPALAAVGQPALPDPRMVRQIIANRQARTRFFDAELFGEPAWDMLLDLTAAHGEGVRVSVTSLCIAAGVPATTALRWLTQMVESGIFVRVPDPADRRRAFIVLSDRSLTAMASYFASLRGPLMLAA
jgi:DNA-binding MarR family transcriptional regulator